MYYLFFVAMCSVLWTLVIFMVEDANKRKQNEEAEARKRIFKEKYGIDLDIDPSYQRLSDNAPYQIGKATIKTGVIFGAAAKGFYDGCMKNK